MMSFWTNVSTVLGQRGISHRALARDVGVTPGALSKYGRGASPSIEVAARIAEVLRLSLDSLMWGTEAALGREICRAPAEHRLLHELVNEFGIEELTQLARMGPQSLAWQISDLLASEYPRAVPLARIRAQIEPASDDDLRASLILLRRRQIIAEVRTEEGVAYARRKPVAYFTARELGDVTMNMKRAVKILFGRVLPALERADDTGHLVTFNGQLSRADANRLSSELTAWLKERLTECLTPEEGDTQVSLVFSIAIAPESE